MHFVQSAAGGSREELLQSLQMSYAQELLQPLEAIRRLLVAGQSVLLPSIAPYVHNIREPSLPGMRSSPWIQTQDGSLLMIKSRSLAQRPH